MTPEKCINMVWLALKDYITNKNQEKLPEGLTLKNIVYYDGEFFKFEFESSRERYIVKSIPSGTRTSSLFAISR